METQVKGCKELYTDVIQAGLCTLCGACVGSCPYLVSYKGRIVMLDKCTIADGQCYKYCPRTHVDMDALSRHTFGAPYRADELGAVREVLMARSTDANLRKRVQYGGTVTALMCLALEEGLIQSAVMSRTCSDKTPAPFLARSVEEVLECAGSNYMACPVLETLNRVPRESEQTMGVVVTPCQGLALAKMKLDPPENRASTDNVRLTIGLFCTWALAPEGLRAFLEQNLDLAQVVKFDIPPPPASRFDAYAASGKVSSFPLDQIRPYVMPTCAYCLDMTSEFADVSVGAVEGIEGWNTVIVRTQRGADLVATARARGRLETGELPAENLAHLKEAALLKKKRALNEIINRSGDRGDLLYVGLSEGVAAELLS
ncbi:MAG: Coenzyme F420 hydrogenase/dehydrogenase, beta subunit C-terminal domain [Chloroflexota bacterium]|nr:Coenzyme F420 hydrogenase/dehydrogenase, beta subunit C-terminal domain [Chloroflexota bacterium]